MGLIGLIEALSDVACLYTKRNSVYFARDQEWPKVLIYSKNANKTLNLPVFTRRSAKTSSLEEEDINSLVS